MTNQGQNEEQNWRQKKKKRQTSKSETCSLSSFYFYLAVIGRQNQAYEARPQVSNVLLLLKLRRTHPQDCHQQVHRLAFQVIISALFESMFSHWQLLWGSCHIACNTARRSCRKCRLEWKNSHLGEETPCGRWTLPQRQKQIWMCRYTVFYLAVALSRLHWPSFSLHSF